MFWIALSLIGAFLQAFGSAVSKKVLKVHEAKNVIGFVSYFFAGIIFFSVHFFSTGTFWMGGLGVKFWIVTAAFSVINVLGAWFLYRALEFAELNYVMPYMTLTSLSLVLPPMFLLGEVPSLGSFFGMAVIVAGAILMNHSKRNLTADASEKRASNRKGLKFFLVTAICFTILPTLAKVAIQESSVVFASFLSHAGTSFGFLSLLFIQREERELRELFLKNSRRYLLFVLLIGLIAVGENGSINAALSMTPVAQVFAIKRLMPLFAFLIGFFYFRERGELPKKIMATALMVAGAIMTIIL